MLAARLTGEGSTNGAGVARLATSRCVAERGSRLALVLGGVSEAGTASSQPVCPIAAAQRVTRDVGFVAAPPQMRLRSGRDRASQARQSSRWRSPCAGRPSPRARPPRPGAHRPLPGPLGLRAYGVPVFPDPILGQKAQCPRSSGAPAPRRCLRCVTGATVAAVPSCLTGPARCGRTPGRGRASALDGGGRQAREPTAIPCWPIVCIAVRATSSACFSCSRLRDSSSTTSPAPRACALAISVS